jgi:tetratricopeptide (TPR) repeat protein
VVQDDYLAYYLLGKGYQKIKKLPEAVANYKKSIELKGDYFNAHNSLGQVYQNQERYNQAFNTYKTAVSLKPDNYRAIYNMAISYQWMSQRDDGNFDNLDKVIGYWNQFLKVARKNPKAKSLIPGIEETVKGLEELKSFMEEEAAG